MGETNHPRTQFPCFYKNQEGVLVLDSKLLEFVSNDSILAKLPTKSVTIIEHTISPDTTHLNITFEHKNRKKTFVFTFKHSSYKVDSDDPSSNNVSQVPIDDAFKNAVFNSLDPDTANQASAQISANNVILAYSILKFYQRRIASNIHSLLIESQHKRKEYSFFKLLLEEFCLKNQVIQEDILMDKFDWIKWLLSLEYTSIDDSKTLKVDIDEFLNNDNKNNFIFDVARNKERFEKYKHLHETKQIVNISEFKDKEDNVDLNDVKETKINQINEYLKKQNKDTVLDYMLNKSFVLPSKDVGAENMNEQVDFDAINRLHIIKHDLISSKKENDVSINSNIDKNTNIKVKVKRKEVKWNKTIESYNVSFKPKPNVVSPNASVIKNNINNTEKEDTFYKMKLLQIGKFWMDY
eukprot:GAHX01001013.1.p1 GENE.GAHX01001013.1~~GAHX01001013.1.p1  ORF type:complete len:429 (+),score=105.21 GAHX01001013.1:63-1289(+)